MKKSIYRLRWSLSAWQLKWLLNCWPPLWCTGIRVLSIRDDFCYARVQMSMRWYNRNFVGTHFGGSLYAMTDPFYMLMLVMIFGKDYYVWDQAAEIQFIKPAREKVTAEFELTDEAIAEIKKQTENGEKTIVSFVVDVKTDKGETVSRVQKRVYVRLKKHD